MVPSPTSLPPSSPRTLPSTGIPFGDTLRGVFPYGFHPLYRSPMRTIPPILTLLISINLLPSCAIGPTYPGGTLQHRQGNLEWTVADTPGGFRASVRRRLEVGFAEPTVFAEGCRRDVVRVALEEAERRSWGVPRVDERRVEADVGVIPGPFYWCMASLGVSPPPK